MRFLRIDEVIDKVGLSRPTIWRLERAGEFPKRRQLGKKSVAWLEQEVEEWLASRAVVERQEEFQSEPPGVVSVKSN